MKQITLILIVIISLLMTSCQNIAEIYESENGGRMELISANENTLIKDLESFNDSIFNTFRVNGFDNEKFKDGLKIAWADAYGAYKGVRLGWSIGSLFGPNAAVIGASVVAPVYAAGKSYIKAQDIKNKTRTNSEINFEECVAASVLMYEQIANFEPYYPKLIQIHFPDGFENCRLVGVKHNLILDNIVNDNYSQSSIQEVYTEIESSILSHADIRYTLMMRIPPVLLVKQ